MNTSDFPDAESWNRAWRGGHPGIIERLVGDAQRTKTAMPAETYAEALKGIRLLSRFPRFMPGPAASSRTREQLMPLLIDLIHLAHKLADSEADAWRDIMKASGVSSGRSKSKSTPTATAPTPSSDEALQEALRIVAAASDADLGEIDWTDNPKSEREAALRHAIICRIESEALEKEQDWAQCMKTIDDEIDAAAAHEGRLPPARDRNPEPTFVASNAYHALVRLAPHDTELCGEDLYDALERWRAVMEEERAQREANERRRLLDAARRDLDGGQQK